MKILKPVLITTLIMAVLAGGAIFFFSGSDDSSTEFSGKITEDQRDEGEERAYRFDIDKTAVPLMTKGEGKNVLNFDTAKLDVDNSKKARERLDRLIKRMDTSVEEPIIAANPFGTNENSFYFYFRTNYSGMIRYTVTVADESIPDHVRYVNNGMPDNLTKEHQFTVSGLVPGMKNYIVIEVLGRTGAKRDSVTYSYDVPSCSARTKLSVEEGKSKEDSTLGLYFVFPKGDSRIYAYDNSGILRNITKTEGVHGSRFYQAGTHVMYQISDTKVVTVNAYGQVTGVAEVKGYGKINDFSYDGYDNIYALVKKKDMDYLVSASFSSGKTRMVYRFPKGVTTRSLTAPVAGTLYVAAASPNGIMKIKALTGSNPEMDFILGKKSAWENTPYRKKVAQDKAAVHWETGRTILNLLDGSNGENDKLSAYLKNKGKGTAVEVVINGKDKSVLEKQSFPTGDEGLCSSQSYDGHTIIASYGRGVFGEYDVEGKVTKEFSVGKEVDGVTKCSLNGLCFFA